MIRKALAVLLGLCMVGTQVGFADLQGTGPADPFGLNSTVNVQVVPLDPPAAFKLNPPLPNALEQYREKGYGAWKLEQSTGYTKRMDLLPQGVKAATKSIQFAQFFTMSDIHIVDVQSPTQPLYFGEVPAAGMQSAYTGSMLYSTQVLDAAVRSVNQINQKSPIDFGLMLGDAANNAQKNEVDMYLDVLTGRWVNPNSNPSVTYQTDYMQSFKANGLDIPWYQVIGNHDHFWEGSYEATEKVKAAAIDDTLMRLSLKNNSRETEGEDVYGGIIDPSTEYGKIVMSGKSTGTDGDTHKTTANTDRRLLTASDFVDLFPKGHGLKSDTSVDPLGCYVVDPKSTIPVRVIVLDNTAPQDTAFIDPTPEKRIMTNAAMAYLTKDKLAWLERQMLAAQAANKLIVVATHIPTGMKGLWSATSEVKEQEFINTLLKYPNMSLLLAGHRHLNTVIPYRSASNDNGFWQVETASLRDFPQQFKLFTFNVNDNGTLSIFANSVDPIMESGSMMEKSRMYAIGASQIYPEPPSIILAKAKSRVENMELLKNLSPGMAELLKGYLK